MNAALKGAQLNCRAKSYIHLLVVETNQDVIESRNAGVGVYMPPGMKMSERESLVE